MAKLFKCERDGVTIRAEDDDQLIERVERHAAGNHPDLVGTLSREDILAMATA